VRIQTFQNANRFLDAAQLDLQLLETLARIAGGGKPRMFKA
jgi:hypothetical protein